MNAETLLLYWEIGKEIFKQQEENGWGKSIVQILAKELQKEFPGAKGYSAANLWRMRNFYLSYRDSEKLAPLVREISWSNNVVIISPPISVRNALILFTNCISSSCSEYSGDSSANRKVKSRTVGARFWGKHE